MATGGVRVDVWLWAVRVYRTRTAATDACRSGKVRIGDSPAKAAQRVAVGDVVVARRGQERLTYRVVEPISKRVGASLAAEAYDDLTPPQDRAPEPGTTAPPMVAERMRGEGRPTKRDRRNIDRFTSPH